MKELKVNEVEEVNGGFVALYWIGVGAFHLYRSYRFVRVVSNAGATGMVVGGLKEYHRE